MDFRAVLIFLCLHIAQASCKSLSSGAVDETIQMIRGEIRKAVDALAAIQLQNASCGSLNATELLGPEQQQLPFIKCYLKKIFELLHDLPMLAKAIQYTEDVESFTSGMTVTKNCSLPSFSQKSKGFEYANCLLEMMHDRLGKEV